MNWYFKSVSASGSFQLPYYSRNLIDYILTRTRSQWGNGVFSFREVTYIKLKNFLGLDIYTPTKNSPYKKLFNNPEFELPVIISCFLHSGQIKGSKIKADVNELKSVRDSVEINVF